MLFPTARAHFAFQPPPPATAKKRSGTFGDAAVSAGTSADSMPA